MTTDPTRPDVVAHAPDGERLRLENEALRQQIGTLRREVDDALQELAALARRQRDVQSETRVAEATLAAIKASNTWRLLEHGRRMRLHVRGLRMRLIGHVGRRSRARRPAGVPDAVRGSAVGVNVAGYLSAESGMGEAARASVRALERAGIPFVLNNVRGEQRANDLGYTAFVSHNPHPFNLVHLNADNMADFARRQGRQYFRDRYTIGFWFWELSRFRDDWLGAFQHVNEVWVATRFAREALRASTTVPVVRMPLPVTVPQPSPHGRAHFGIAENRFVFLFTFDVSSQTERKNPLAVVRAFRRSGLARDRATLVLKFTNGHFDPGAVRRLAEAGEGSDVVMLDGFMDRPELAALMSASDCYVSLHRAEGFGLTMAEAMALQKPVIATAYSGNTDFMTPESACLIDYRLVPLTRDHGPYLRGFEWAEPDIDQAAEAMRQMAESPEWAAEIGRRGAKAMAACLGLDQAAERYRRRLEAIRAGSTAVNDDE
jgi:glycosyltransferase involved in cell wall biosynthesis